MEINMDFETKPISREIVIDGFNSIYYFEFGKEFSHPIEKHEFWELTYVDSGEMYAITEGVGYMMTQGQVIFNAPGELHAHISNRRVPNNMLVIAFTSNSPAMEFFNKKIFTLGKTEKTLLSLFMKEASLAIGTLPQDYEDKNPVDFSSAPFGSVQLLECYLTELLLQLCRQGDESFTAVESTVKTRELGHSSIIELIIGYMEKNICKNIGLNDVCREFYMGKSHLCKLFADYVGESPMEYFAKLKIKESKKLLRQEMSIGDIAETLGYSSIHSFSRAFKSAVGFSPSEYRKTVVDK